MHYPRLGYVPEPQVPEQPVKPATVVGCLLDVSASMRKHLETDCSKGGTVERLRAVLGAALKIARAELQRDPGTFMFVGVFGLKVRDLPVVDLCGVVQALVGGEDGKTGHELLIELANKNNRTHITRFIESKFTDVEALILSAYLRLKPGRVENFVKAIPTAGLLQGVRNDARKARTAAGGEFWSHGFGSIFAGIATDVVDSVENIAVEYSEAMKLAHNICDWWLMDFKDLVPRPVADVVRLLEQLHKHPMTGDCAEADANPGSSALLNTLRRYMYGRETPMSRALVKSRSAFEGRLSLPQRSIHPSPDQRILLLISDGKASDGHVNRPLDKAHDLQLMDVTIASVYLTSDLSAPRRRLYDQAADDWDQGLRTLFHVATKVSGNKHPIPVLTSMGWEVPSSGECALYTTVCSAEALDEFCSLLLSASFGSADSLLDIIGRVQLDAIVNDAQVQTCKNPSDQGQSSTCYAHAIAAVIHMALIRIPGRDGGCPSIKEIRSRILQNFPPGSDGRVTEDVLKTAITWYRPLQYREVDADGARQAVLHRRPLLTRFRLSDPGWDTFSDHFADAATSSAALTRSEMDPHRSLPDGGGHAVVMVGCDPHSLTFLNSWGNQWGNNGSFSIENPSVLELDGANASQMHFYDVYWNESDLTAAERKAYDDMASKVLSDRAKQYPSIFELETRCSRCNASAPIADFTGSVRQAVCPLCRQSFQPEPGHLVQALYARAGLSVVM